MTTTEIKVGDKVIWDTFKKFRVTHVGVVTKIIDNKAKVQRDKAGRKVTTTEFISSLELFSK